MKIPIKYSAAEAQALIAQKMRDKSLTFGERRELEDQYAQLSNRSFAKGGIVTKGKEMNPMMKRDKKEKAQKEMGKKVVKGKMPVLAIMIDVSKPKKIKRK